MSKKIKKDKKRTALKGKFAVGNFKQTFKRIMSYLGDYKLRLTVALICMVANVLSNIAGTYMLSVIIDKYIIPLASGSTEVTLAGFGIMVGIMAAIYAAGALLYYIFNRTTVKITCEVLQKIRDDMFEKMQKLPIKFFDTHSHGELMSCFTNDTDTLREFLASGLPSLLSNGLMVIGIFIMMMIMSPLLTLFIIIMLIIMLFII
ncbi:MAG: ABC transporter transmembrane domain-containing protein, partial [Clostridia bacterium]